MKKVLVLSLFAMAALVSQAWGQGYCYYAPGNCHPMPTDDNCEWGTLVSDCSNPGFTTKYCNYGPCVNGSGYDCESGGCYAMTSGGTCTGGTEVSTCPAGTAPPGAGGGGDNPPGGGTPSTGDMCLWNAAGACWPVPSPDGQTVADCERDGWHFSGGTQGAATFCEGGTFVAGKTNTPPTAGSAGTSLGCCKWSENNAAGKCWDVYEAQEVTDCNYEPNQFWSGACPDTQGTCPSGTPIIKFTPANISLMVAPFGRSLHISSAKDATVSLYDMNGVKVYSGKVRAGNSVFSLEKISSGSYYAVVQSGSASKKVSVILK